MGDGIEKHECKHVFFFPRASTRIGRKRAFVLAPTVSKWPRGSRREQRHRLISVRIDLPPVRPNGLFGPCSRALIGGAQPYMVGGPLSHSAIKERWGPGLAV